MVNKIVEGAASALFEAMGEGYPIYRDDLRQGLEPPCFLILSVGPSLAPHPSGIKLLTVPLDISYFPSDSGDNAEMYRVGLTVMDAVELIPLSEEKKLRGLRRSMEIVDGVLHISVTYEAFLRKDQEIDPMEILDLHIHLRES